MIWESDHPVDIFNVVGGRWTVRRGEGRSIIYHPEHSYNIDEMLRGSGRARAGTTRSGSTRTRGRS